MRRISKDNYYLDIAQAVSKRSTCIRRKYGAVLVKNDRIISTGYNGSCKGDINCTDTGKCKRQDLNIPAGERYELCKAVHAEMNAVINADKADMEGSTLYLYLDSHMEENSNMEVKPCLLCSRVLKNAGVISIVTMDNIGNIRKTLIENLFSWRALYGIIYVTVIKGGNF